jgi:hypothetical protein
MGQLDSAVLGGCILKIGKKIKWSILVNFVALVSVTGMSAAQMRYVNGEVLSVHGSVISVHVKDQVLDLDRKFIEKRDIRPVSTGRKIRLLIAPVDENDPDLPEGKLDDRAFYNARNAIEFIEEGLGFRAYQRTS